MRKRNSSDKQRRLDSSPEPREHSYNTTREPLYSVRISRRQMVAALVSTAVFGIPRQARATLTPIKPFSFAMVSDTHVTNDLPDTHILYHESQLFLQEAVKQINKIGVDFVIFGGDQVEGPGKRDENWNLFVDVIQNLECKWNFILGDRDISGETLVDKMRTYGPDWKGKGLETNKPYWSQSPAHNVHLIGLDTSRPGSKEGLIVKDQLSWLKNELRANISKFTILFSHHPLLPPSPYSGGPPWSNYGLTNAASALEIVQTSPYVRLAISAHVGINAVRKEQNTYFISCPSLVSYPCAFKVFRVDSDQILMETYQIEFKSLVKKARKALEDSTLAYYYNKGKPREFVKVSQGDKIAWDAQLPLGGGMTPSPARKKKENNKKKRWSLF